MRREIIVDVLFFIALAFLVRSLMKGFFKGSGFFSFLSPSRDGLDLKLPRPLDDSRQEISNEEAKNIAETQFEAMDKIGTSEGLLFDSLTGLNGADLLAVVKSFGRRRYDGIAKGSMFIGKMLNLIQWYKADLNNSENDQLLSIYEKSGLTW